MGSFDVGSGTTKALVARVAPCETPMMSVIWESSHALALKEDLSIHKSLSEAIFEEAIKVISKLKDEMKERKATTFRGVATMALRQAPNGQQFIERLSQRVDFPIKIISQRDEALLGALSARTLRPDVGARVIWDIGGASAQWVYQFEGKTHFALSSLASVSFKEEILKSLKSQRSSPNPLGGDGQKVAQAIALRQSQRFSTSLKTSIEKSQNIVLGIGGVHRYSILGKLKKLNLIDSNQQSYVRGDLEKAIKELVNKNDQQVGGDYAKTDVTNLILVHTQMQYLAIEKVEVAQGNLALGAIVRELVKKD